MKRHTLGHIIGGTVMGAVLLYSAGTSIALASGQYGRGGYDSYGYGGGYDGYSTNRYGYGGTAGWYTYYTPQPIYVNNNYYAPTYQQYSGYMPYDNYTGYNNYGGYNGYNDYRYGYYPQNYGYSPYSYNGQPIGGGFYPNSPCYGGFCY